jgi:hypothetical protein
MMKYLYGILVFILAAPNLVWAALSYENALVNIPGYDDSGGDFGAFVNLIYGLAISIAALLAVIKIVIAGVKWMLSDIVTDKTDAKKDIQGALIGLIVIVSAVLIITIINPDIVN